LFGAVNTEGAANTVMSTRSVLHAKSLARRMRAISIEETTLFERDLFEDVLHERYEMAVAVAGKLRVLFV